jgi:polyhydroxyalkanoate synthase
MPAKSAAPVTAKKPAAVAAKGGDDLTRISGIGPKLSALLKEKGIDSFARLASMEAQAIKDLLLSEGSGYSRYDTSSWPDQARELAE